MDKDKVITIQTKLIAAQETLITNLQKQLALQETLQNKEKPDSIDSASYKNRAYAYKNRAYAAEDSLARAKATISHLESEIQVLKRRLEGQTPKPLPLLELTYYRSRTAYLESALKEARKEIVRLKERLENE